MFTPYYVTLFYKVRTNKKGNYVRITWVQYTFHMTLTWGTLIALDIGLDKSTVEWSFNRHPVKYKSEDPRNM